VKNKMVKVMSDKWLMNLAREKGLKLVFVKIR
jgi:hypothetical protein